MDVRFGLQPWHSETIPICIEVAMRNTVLVLFLVVLCFGCVEEEIVLAYQYDPEKLCLVDSDSPIEVARREPKGPNPTTLLRPTCSINEDRRLVSFQTYFTEEFVDCYHVWEEVVYWEEVPGKTSISDLECQD